MLDELSHNQLRPGNTGFAESRCGCNQEKAGCPDDDITSTELINVDEQLLRQYVEMFIVLVK